MGKCYKGLENRAEAEKSLLKSLSIDPTQIHVFDEFLTVREGNLEDIAKIIDSFNFKSSDEWLKDFYKLRNSKQALSVFTQSDEQEKKKFSEKQQNQNQIELEIELQKENPVNNIISNLIHKKNTEILYLKAEALFKNYELAEAYKVCKTILSIDSFHFKTLNIYSELLVERKVLN